MCSVPKLEKKSRVPPMVRLLDEVSPYPSVRDSSCASTAPVREDRLDIVGGASGSSIHTSRFNAVSLDTGFGKAVSFEAPVA